LISITKFDFLFKNGSSSLSSFAFKFDFCPLGTFAAGEGRYSDCTIFHQGLDYKADQEGKSINLGIFNYFKAFVIFHFDVSCANKKCFILVKLMKMREKLHRASGKVQTKYAFKLQRNFVN